MELQIFALLERNVKFLQSVDLIYTVVEACNHTYFGVAIHVVPASFPTTEEGEF